MHHQATHNMFQRLPKFAIRDKLLLLFLSQCGRVLLRTQAESIDEDVGVRSDSGDSAEDVVIHAVPIIAHAPGRSF